MKILFLEDDSIIANLVTDFLNDFYDVQHCYNSSDALRFAEEADFDLYIFDINVPGISGLELLKSLRNFNDATPAIFITAYQELTYLKEAFSLGANDFLRKPFEIEELQLRIENIKALYSIDTDIPIEDICFSPTTHQLITADKTIAISAKESALLEYLIRNKHRVISSNELLQNLWEYDEMPSQDAIRTYIKKLRNLIGKEHIQNIRGEGYKFE